MAEPAPVPAPDGARSPSVRVTDEDRRRAAELVAEAAGAGLLSLDEADARMAAAYRARTTGELAALRTDLPPAWLAARERERRSHEVQRLARTSLRAHLLSYASGMMLLVGIWLVVGLTAGAWYPWPVWPALGWGIGVWSHARAAAGHPAGRACGARAQAAPGRG